MSFITRGPSQDQLRLPVPGKFTAMADFQKRGVGGWGSLSKGRRVLPTARISSSLPPARLDLLRLKKQGWVCSGKLLSQVPDISQIGVGVIVCLTSFHIVPQNTEVTSREIGKDQDRPRQGLPRFLVLETYYSPSIVQ